MKAYIAIYRLHTFLYLTGNHKPRKGSSTAAVGWRWEPEAQYVASASFLALLKGGNVF